MGSTEVPVFRLGIAGFSVEQEAAIRAAAAASRITHWICGPMPGADAWVVNGQCTQPLGEGRIRVASRHAGGRSVQLQLDETKRPVGFATPVPPTMQGVRTFDVAQPQAIVEAIGLFEFVLAPLAAQFLLASHIVDQQDVLGTGAFEVRSKGQLIAVVDMKGVAGVLASVRPGNFDAAVWTRIDRARLRMPANFCRASLSELMWRYVSRSSRNLLPERYRKGPIFFRRAPRVEPVLLEEHHLLLMRELAIAPCTFDELQHRLDLSAEEILSGLAALYYVGAITSNRARAAPTSIAGDVQGRLRSQTHYGESRSGDFELTDLRQLTAPAPLAFT